MASPNPFALSLSKDRLSKNPTKPIPPCVTPGPHP